MRLGDEARFAIHVEKRARSEDVVGASDFDGKGLGVKEGDGGEETNKGVGVGDNIFVGYRQLTEEVHDMKRGSVALLLRECVDETAP